MFVQKYFDLLMPKEYSCAGKMYVDIVLADMQAIPDILFI